MMNIKGGRGLLIDLDMAKNLNEPKDTSKFAAVASRIFSFPPAHVASMSSKNTGTSDTQTTSSEQGGDDGPSQTVVARESITVCSYH
jgi:hypothetical protein